MAKPKATIHIVYNKFPELIRKSPEKAKELVKKAAFELEARAKLEAKVDTGFMRNSIYTVTFAGSGYAAAKQAAEAANPDARMIGEVGTPGEYQAFVAVGAEYAIYVEYGTRFMAAQPFMTPAVEQVRKSFERAVKDELVKP